MGVGSYGSVVGANQAGAPLPSPAMLGVLSLQSGAVGPLGAQHQGLVTPFQVLFKPCY